MTTNQPSEPCPPCRQPRHQGHILILGLFSQFHQRLDRHWSSTGKIWWESFYLTKRLGQVRGSLLGPQGPQARPVSPCKHPIFTTLPFAETFLENSKHLNPHLCTSLSLIDLKRSTDQGWTWSVEGMSFRLKDFHAFCLSLKNIFHNLQLHLYI